MQLEDGGPHNTGYVTTLPCRTWWRWRLYSGSVL